MLRPRWKKVLRDLWHYKTRTILVVLSIAVGVFAFGTIAASRINILESLRDSYRSVNPSSATITAEPFQEALVDVVSGMPGVAVAQGQRKVSARVRVGEYQWQDLELYVLPDDGQMQINIVRPERGAWPPPRHALLIERSSLGKLRARPGDLVQVQMSDGEERTLPIAGLTHDLSLPPAPIAGKAFGYISFDTLEWFGGPRSYNDMLIVVEEGREDEPHIRSIANEVADKIEHSGREVEVIDVPEPLQHPAEQIIPTILLILGGLGVLTLLLGMFLIINTIEAILAQQVRQIGIMKAVGARRRQIMVLYFGMVIAFGILALILAFPLGTVGAMGFTRFMTDQLNIDLEHFYMPPPVVLLKIAAALLLPVLATVPAVRSAVTMTIREALTDSGPTQGKPGTSIIDRLIHHIRGLPRPLLLSLRNTFRRKWRLLRTLAVLALGGAVFMSVLTVRASLFHTLDESVESKRYDVEVRFSRPYRSAKVEQGVLDIPGVVGVESWGFARAYPVRADGSEGESINLYAPPADTALLDLRIWQGHWLRPGDDNGIVVSSNYISKKEPGTQLGDTIVLKIDGEEYTWRIVGISREFMSPIQPAIGYVTYDSFARRAGDVGRVNNLQVAAAQHDPAFQEQVAQALEAYTERANLDVRLIQSTSENRAILGERFNLLTSILSVMAVLIASVGGIGLTGTMSINIIERSKEIGIMRAIGAADGAIRQIVVAEGIIIALLSWAIGTVLSLPISRVMSIRLGYNLLNEPLSYTYASYAVVLWLVLVVVLALVASLLPARNALRITIREVLAYE
jgi:putative ABC transport system permease protein